MSRTGTVPPDMMHCQNVQTLESQRSVPNAAGAAGVSSTIRTSTLALCIPHGRVAVQKTSVRSRPVGPSRLNLCSSMAARRHCCVGAWCTRTRASASLYSRVSKASLYLYRQAKFVTSINQKYTRGAGIQGTKHSSFDGAVLLFSGKPSCGQRLHNRTRTTPR